MQWTAILKGAKVEEDGEKQRREKAIHGRKV
jgi:hypothetical protein